MQLFGKRIEQYKKELFQLQEGKCKICKNSLDQWSSAHLDHDHQLTGKYAGRCRGLLCRACNVQEGRVYNRFVREGLRGKVEYTDWLRQLADYYNQDFSNNPFHQNYPNDFLKRFKKMQLSDMKQMYTNYNFQLPDGKITKEILIKDFSKKFKKHQKEL